jgi:hypothetical protein
LAYSAVKRHRLSINVVSTHLPVSSTIKIYSLLNAGFRVIAFISPSPQSPPLKGGEEFGMDSIERLCPE